MLRLEDVERVSRFRAGELTGVEADAVRQKLAVDPEWRTALERLDALDTMMPQARNELLVSAPTDGGLVRKAALQATGTRRIWPWALGVAGLLGVVFAAGWLAGHQPPPAKEPEPESSRRLPVVAIAPTANLDAGMAAEADGGVPALLAAQAEVDSGPGHAPPRPAHLRDVMMATRGWVDEDALWQMRARLAEHQQQFAHCYDALHPTNGSMARFTAVLTLRQRGAQGTPSQVAVNEDDPGENPLLSACVLSTIQATSFATPPDNELAKVEVQFPIRFEVWNGAALVVLPQPLRSGFRSAGADPKNRPAVNPRGISSGPISAKTTVVLFLDVTRPNAPDAIRFALKLHAENQVRLTIKHRPYPGDSAMLSARFLEAVAKQGHFWEFLEGVERFQPRRPDDFLNVALGLQLDVKRIQDDYESDEVTSAVEADLREAASVGVLETPQWSVDGAAFTSRVPRELEGARREPQ